MIRVALGAGSETQLIKAGGIVKAIRVINGVHTVVRVSKVTLGAEAVVRLSKVALGAGAVG